MVAARLDAALAGQRLVRAELRWPTLATADLTGRVVLHTRPFGKHLLTRLDDGRTLHSHLRMDGTWQVVPTSTPTARARSPRVRALLDDGTSTALGLDLGMLDLVMTSREHELIGRLGPDILDASFDPEIFDGESGPADTEPTDAKPAAGTGLAESLDRWASRGDAPACEVLIDQRVVAGVGTIWMAEALFATQVHPWAPADQVDPVVLLRTARRFMRASVAAGAPTIRVHGRRGRPCPRCGTPLAKGTAGKAPVGRPVFWCPTCQKR